MKLVTYRDANAQRVGVLLPDGVHDAGFEGDMIALIEGWDQVRHRVEEGAHSSPPVRDAVLMAPLRPRSLRDFLTFEGHLKNAMTNLGRPIAPEWYTTPAYYKGMPDTVIGPEQEIPWPRYTEKLDHELELAIVIGRKGKDIPRESALDHVFGYTLWNDMSARDVQSRELPVGMGPAKAKDWDGSNVLGPCLVTADEVDANDIRLTVRVNGETWGGDSTARMHHRIEDLIAYASQAQTLYPGEVLGSGTATGGSGVELNRWLAPGDVIEMEAEGIGVLRNRVGKPGGE
ncbi:MAG: fumarylacetoacetate hydrolase family protein [Candidatus Dormibacteraeota bacterium]|nr:fumarylacetoacetate hydrolase family protein [Candidatus Dormibacteraeota bacterium]